MEPGRQDVSPPLALPEVLAAGEDWLMARVLAFAKEHGYAASTSTLAEPWRASIVGLSRVIAAAWSVFDGRPHEYPASGPAGDDPVAVFARREAARHRERGVTLAMFWGLLKYYRRAYAELLERRLPPGDEGRQALAFVGECFERMEYAFVLGWTTLSGPAVSDALARENRRLAAEKNKYLAVFESIPQAVFLLSDRGVVEHCNAGGLALARHPVAAAAAASTGAVASRPVIGQPLPEILPFLAPFLARRPAADAGVEDEVIEPGTERWFWASSQPLRDVSSPFPGRIVLCRDVTEAHRAEASLRELKERYQTLVDLMHQGLVIFSPHGTIDYANDTFCDLLGLPAVAVIGREAAAFVRPEERQRFAAEQASRRAGRAEPYEIHLRRADGHVLSVMASPSPVMGPEGEFQGSLEVVTNVTELRNLEMRLTTAKRLEAIGHLAGGVAHEINTPLQYVSGNLDFALANLPRLTRLIGLYENALRQAGDAPALERAKGILETYRQEYDLETVLAELPQALAESLSGAQRVAAFVRSIKRFAQSETEGRRVIDVAEALATTVEVAKSAVQDAVDLALRLDEDLPPLACVPGDFNQLMLCLLLNAAQAVEAAGKGRGRVVVAGRRAGAFLELSVSDNGIGIPVAIQEKIFNPFFTTKDVGQGTGQGLSIALSIVQKHHGTIRFETEPDRGTTFFVTFPLDEGS